MPREAVVPHTLFSREIRPITDWTEWLACWQGAKTLQEMISLLHVGFDQTIACSSGIPNESEQRLVFYFGVADGWADIDLLKVPEDYKNGHREETFFGYDSNYNRVYKTPAYFRQLVAQKAFGVLCSNFFKIDLLQNESGKFNYVWKGVVTSERLFLIIRDFFRVEMSGRGDVAIRNLTRFEERSHNELKVITFLVNLATFIWGWDEYEVENYRPDKTELEKDNVETRARLNASKPWMIEVLAKIKRLDLLRGWLLKLDRPCLAKLKEVALRAKLCRHLNHPVIEDRLVATVEEACYIGSSAALLLNEYNIKRKEQERLKAIFEVECEKAQLDEKLRRLAIKK